MPCYWITRVEPLRIDTPGPRPNLVMKDNVLERPQELDIKMNYYHRANVVPSGSVTMYSALPAITGSA